MILLTTPSDRLQIVTDAAVPLAVHASYMDTDGTNVSPGRTNTAISTATTTEVVGGAPGGQTRNLKVLTVRNGHATTPVGVTVRHTDGTTVVELTKVTLAAGWRIQYTDDEGFRVFDAAGVLQ